MSIKTIFSPVKFFLRTTPKPLRIYPQLHQSLPLRHSLTIFNNPLSTKHFATTTINRNSGDSGHTYASDIDTFIMERDILPKLASTTPVNPSRSLLKCINFDNEGNFKLIASDINKTQLILKHDLLPRDLRKIDKGYDDIVPSLLVREHSMLLNILHIKALIKADSVVLFNYGSSYSNERFIRHLSTKLKNTSGEKLPYEIRALEAIFVDVLENLSSEMKVHVTVVNGILKELEDDIDLTKLKYLLLVSKKLSQFQQKATLIRDLIDELLDQEDELVELYLTEKKNQIERAEHDHQEVELLLESYSLHCDSIVQTIEKSVNDVKTTEEIINIILDSNRNDLMLLGLRMSIGLLSFGSLLFVGAAYGMNLHNFIEDKEYWFGIVVTGCCLSTMLIMKKANSRLTQLQRVQVVKRC
ncbi:unnamed protein product [Ambrosiozyma monospora]|uniref:Magnesium transporter n=1 Tax=Ambrosiozyma monospora TaxID=43982 RepID=A0A9W6YZA0_AMBMO|nr:unnamed protein product [Ambrosiozyma monospora]